MQCSAKGPQDDPLEVVVLEGKPAVSRVYKEGEKGALRSEHKGKGVSPDDREEGRRQATIQIRDGEKRFIVKMDSLASVKELYQKLQSTM